MSSSHLSSNWSVVCLPANAPRPERVTNRQTDNLFGDKMGSVIKILKMTKRVNFGDGVTLTFDTWPWKVDQSGHYHYHCVYQIWEQSIQCFLSYYPSALRAGGVLSSRSGRAGDCQTCGTRISATARRIFSIRSSVELSKPLVVHCHGHLPICLIWACPWAKNLSNLAQIGSRLCGMQISETAGWIYPI